jgi:hypothetical protein
MVGRVFNAREHFYGRTDSTIESNIYPVTANAFIHGPMMIKYLQTKPSKHERRLKHVIKGGKPCKFSLKVDRPCGITSPKSGSLMVNIYRTSGSSDNRGMN